MTQRTQIYLREDQRARIDTLAVRNNVSMPEVVRRAIDTYLDACDDLDSTFGAARGLRMTAPSRNEWTGR